MSFYCVIRTELSKKKYIIAALAEMQRKGEITSFVVNIKKEKIEVDRDGEVVTVSRANENSNFEIGGISRPAREISDRMKQLYAYESIKDNLPLDFEIANETEEAGEIVITLKG